MWEAFVKTLVGTLLVDSNPNTPLKGNCFLRKMDFPRLSFSPEAVFLLLWVDTPVRMQSRKFYSGNKRLKTYVQTRPHEKCSRHMRITKPHVLRTVSVFSLLILVPQKGHPSETQTNRDFTQVQCTFHTQIQTSAMLQVRGMYLINTYTSPLQKRGGWGSPLPCREKSPVTLTLQSAFTPAIQPTADWKQHFPYVVGNPWLGMGKYCFLFRSCVESLGMKPEDILADCINWEKSMDKWTHACSSSCYLRVTCSHCPWSLFQKKSTVPFLFYCILLFHFA